MKTPLSSIPFSRTALLLAGLCLPLPDAALGQAPQATPVSVVFGNNTADDCNIVFFKSDKSLGQPTLLKAGTQVAAGKSYPGQVWVIKDAAGAKTLAQYTVDSSAVQNVGLKSLIAYQTPCTIVFQNDKLASGNDDWNLDILWRKADGTEDNYCHPLEPGKQYVNTDTLPGHVWRVRYQGELVGEYTVQMQVDKDGNPVPQVLSMQSLIDSYVNRVSLTFSNSTQAPVSIYWVQGREELLYAPKLPAAKAYVQAAQPNSTWRIKDASGNAIADFQAKADKAQLIDIGKLSN